MNSTGKMCTVIASVAMMAAMLTGNATAQVLTLHGNQATQQVTYATSGGTLDPQFPVQVQHELDPGGSNVVRATYVTPDSLLINVGDKRCLGLKKSWSGHDGLVIETCRDDGSQVFRRVGERLEIDGRCLDAAHPAGGPHVIAAACNGGDRQRWVRRSDDEIRKASGSGGCLTVYDDVSVDAVKLEPCYPGGHVQQQFLTLAP
jgi:hypothetical protein